MNDISPHESVDQALRYWWVIALAMIAGGVIGWGVSHLSAPVYEARAGYRVNIDDDALLAELRKTNPEAELNYDIRAPYLTPVALVFYLPEVRSEVEEQARAEGLAFPSGGFRAGDLSLDQRGSEWTIIVRHGNNDTAAKLANMWVDTADKFLRQAHEEAVQAQALKMQMAVLSNCFSDMNLVEVNQCAGTTFTDVREIQAYFKDFDRRYQEALTASKGISTLVTFDRGSVAEPPERPVYYNTSLLMLAGSLIGLLIAGAAVQRLPVKNT
jgi:hypothetical protein